jgi:hypothetical protein
MRGLQTNLTEQVERILGQHFRIEECTVLLTDSDGNPGVQNHSPDHPEFQNTLSIKPRSMKPGDWRKNQIKDCTILQNFTGNRFGHPYTPRVGDTVLVVWLGHRKPIILGPVVTDSQQPVMRGPNAKDAMYDLVWKWCQWLKPIQNQTTGDFHDHPPGQDATCIKIFHGPVTGVPGKGRDSQLVYDCQKGNICPDEKADCGGCPSCNTIDSVLRSGEQWVKNYSKETESEEAYNSRYEVHTRCGSYLRFESDDHNPANKPSLEYSEGIGHIRIGNAVNETYGQKAHINFNPTGTVDIHSAFEEVSIEHEVLGARMLVTGADMIYSDSFGTIAQENIYLPKHAGTRIYRDGSIRSVANAGTENGSSECMLNSNGACHLWNILEDTYIEFPTDGNCNVKATTINLDGDVVITGSITHGEDLSCVDLTERVENLEENIGNSSAFVLTNGKAGGQTICGGTVSGENLTLESNSSVTPGKVTIQPSGCVCVGNVTTPLAKLCVNGGCNIGGNTDPGDDNLYVVGNCSAQSFTDRTEAFTGEALKAISKISPTEDGMIDHETLPEFAVVSQVGGNKERNVGNMVSILTTAVQELMEELEKRDKKINDLRERLEKLEVK